ncbi:MAG: TonB-dependent receptor [Paracoccaceae bacterium]
MEQLRKTTALGAILIMLSSGAWAQDQLAIDVPAQPLLEALSELSAETGTPIMVRRDLLADVQSVTVTGPMSPRQALERMIAGTRLSVRELPDESLVVSDDAQMNFVSQDATEAPFDLGTLILRGELLDRPLQDSATSAAVIRGEELEASGDIDITEAIERTPGVSVLNDDGGFSIRGISQFGVGGAGSGLTVSTQVDGVALPSFGLFEGPFSTWDLEQVEVLRGPQSTQQGRNALAGAVIVRSKDPELFPEFKLRTEVGTQSTQGFALMANTPLIEDRLAFRFAAEILSSDGFINNAFLGNDADNRENETYRAKLRWAPADNFDAVLSHSYTENFRGRAQFDGDEIPDDFSVRQTFNDTDDTTHRNTGLRMTWDVSDTLQLESETNFYTLDRIGIIDLDDRVADLAQRDDREQSDVFEQDLRLKFSSGRVSGVVGLFYTQIDESRLTQTRVDLGLATVGIPNGFSITQDNVNTVETENFAIFGEVDIRVDEIAEGLSFTLGARYDREDLDFGSATRFSSLLPPPFQDADNATTTSFEAFLPKAGVTYDFNDDQSVSFTVQAGYRSGGVNLGGLVAGFSRFTEFDPEYTTNYELAYRGKFYEERLRVAANIFYTSWRDQQIEREVTTPGTTDTFFETVNAGESRVWGGEVSVSGEPTERLSLFGSVAYANTRFDDFPLDSGANLRGNVFPDAPEVTAAFGGSYTWDSGVKLGMTASYRDNAFSDADNMLPIDSRWLVDLNLTYQRDDWLIGAYARNLFDEKYKVFSSGPRLGGPARFSVGDRRAIGVFAQRTF